MHGGATGLARWTWPALGQQQHRHYACGAIDGDAIGTRRERWSARKVNICNKTLYFDATLAWTYVSSMTYRTDRTYARFDPPRSDEG